MISLDTEVSGLDVFHGAKPFFVTTCTPQQQFRCWQWEVNPLTREPDVQQADLEAIVALLDDPVEADVIVGQNLKFDVHALESIGIVDWPWERTEDTLIAGHLLGSNLPHNLTDMVMQYLRVDIKPLEKVLEQEVQAARQFCRSHLPEWRIARKGLPEMPSAKEKVWKSDSWLPRALVKHLWEESMCFKTWQERGSDNVALSNVDWLPGFDLRPPSLGGADVRWTVLADYSNADSLTTIRLWQEMERLMVKRGHMKLYRARMNTVRIACEMESTGMTVDRDSLNQLRGDFSDESARCEEVCLKSAAKLGFNLTLPKAGNNASLTEFLLEGLRLRPTKWTPTGKPSVDKLTLEAWEKESEPESVARLFLHSLRDKRRRDTALSYLESYERFMLPLGDGDVSGRWQLLHPNWNNCGTDTLRWSSNNPNATNYGKQEIECSNCDGDGCEKCSDTGITDLNLRRILGPAPGREWWSLDAKNIEGRIPAYECGEEELIALYERADDPPYYGSVHLLNFHTVYPDVWNKELKVVGIEKVGPFCKKKYAATNYQWTKNAGFAKQYGGQRRKVDETFRRVGAYDLIDKRLPRMAALNASLIAFANKHGWVETIPDKSIDPDHGYPILCSRSESGWILPTVPLNYHVQSSACWAVSVRWLTECDLQLRAWKRQDGFDGRVILDVHDELVFDFPKRGDPVADARIRNGQGPLMRTSLTSNLWRVRVLQGLLAKVGDDIGVPLLSGMEHHAKNYAEGVTL